MSKLPRITMSLNSEAIFLIWVQGSIPPMEGERRMIKKYKI